MRRQDKLKNIQEANERMLETHVDTDEGKMDYIKGALKNLSSEDLDKVYAQVEMLDPEYEGRGKK
tara:strand:+ start:945 stop:1139 length:195 start_codon:yes stop_codon:yes gene_type:complete